MGGALTSEPLILPDSVRLLRLDEVPFHDDRETILERVAAGQRAAFVAGYVLIETSQDSYAGYAEINVHAPHLWTLFRALVVQLLPEYAALLIGVKDEELYHCPYRSKALLLDALEPFGSALSRDGFVQFGLIWQRGGKTEEVFVEPAKYLKIWTNQRELLENTLAKHGLKRADRLAFLDEYPRVTEPISHIPEMYQYDELIERVLRADGQLPDATPPAVNSRRHR